MDAIEIIDTQTEVIRMQSTIIDGLFMRLAQNIPTEELFAMPEIDAMNKAVELRESIGEDILEGIRWHE